MLNLVEGRQLKCLSSKVTFRFHIFLSIRLPTSIALLHPSNACTSSMHHACSSNFCTPCLRVPHPAETPLHFPNSTSKTEDERKTIEHARVGESPDFPLRTSRGTSYGSRTRRITTGTMWRKDGYGRQI